MSRYQDHRIYGAPFSLHLSPVDQVTPPIYSRRVLVFSRPDGGQDHAISILKAGMQRTVDELPFLAGQMGLETTGWTVKSGGHARLRIKQIDMSLSDLEERGFSESMLLAETLSSVPGLTDPQEEWHVCRIQANFIRGGLLLVISINHTITDGYGITKITEILARNCRAHSHGPRDVSIDLDRSALFHSAAEADVNQLAAYSIVTGPTSLGAAAPEVVTATFSLSVPALKALKAAALPAQDWITTHDAVNALCWRIHAKGRHQAGLITDGDIARFAFPVDFRTIINPPLLAEYYGNAVLMTKVELPVDILLGPDGLSAAAMAIREGVRQIDAVYVDNFISVAKSLENPRQLKINLKLQQPDTAFGSTSYKSFAHSTMDWDHSLGTFKRFRLSWGVTGEGMSIILPVLEDGSWEVTVTLLKELEQRLRTDEEWNLYCTGPAYGTRPV